jgi:hypothetical protein
MYVDPNLSPEQRKHATAEYHKKMQLSENAFSVMLPVRASLYAVIKAFFNEAKRSASVPAYIQTLRSMLIWAEVNSGRSDDNILDAIEDEIDRVRAKKDDYAKKDNHGNTEDSAS